MHNLLFTAFAGAVLAHLGNAAMNGVDVTPKMGWNSWQTHPYCRDKITQQIMEEAMDALVKTRTYYDGTTTTLRDLGYKYAHMDDGYQACAGTAASGVAKVKTYRNGTCTGGYGPKCYTSHNATGWPVIDTTRFPDINGMVAHGHSLGLKVGWYMNNDVCKDHCTEDYCYRGDVDFLVQAGFDQVLSDTGDHMSNITFFAELLNASGRPVSLHSSALDFVKGHQSVNGLSPAYPAWNHSHPEGCVVNTFNAYVMFDGPFDPHKGTGHIFVDLMIGLEQGLRMNEWQMSFPGCWSSGGPGMWGGWYEPLGNHKAPYANFTLGRTEFGLNCILSRTMYIGLDVRIDDHLALAWEYMSNKEAIYVNQHWEGFSGSAFYRSKEQVIWEYPEYRCYSAWATPEGHCRFPTWQYFYKPQPNGTVAVLLLNGANTTVDLTVDISTIPGMTHDGVYNRRDVWNHEDLPAVMGTFTHYNVMSHDTVFLLLAPQ